MPETGHQPTTPAGNNAAGDMIRTLLEPFQNEAVATRVAIEDRSRSQRRINAWLIAFVAVMTVLVVMMLWMLVKDGQRRAQSREVLRNNAALSAQIVDCTNTGGTCYEANQRKLRATIDQLMQANKAIALCARTADTDTELDRCIAARLTSAAKPSPTS